MLKIISKRKLEHLETALMYERARLRVKENEVAELKMRFTSGKYVPGKPVKGNKILEWIENQAAFRYRDRHIPPRGGFKANITN